MKKPNIKKNMQGMLFIFVAMFCVLGGYLLFINVTYGEEWFSTPYNPRISTANNIANAGDIYDRNGVLLAHSEGSTRHYAQDADLRRAVSHTVGDVYGKSLGAETYFAKYLYGHDRGLLNTIATAASGTSGGDVYLTIDARLCEYIYDNMDYNGAVVLMDYTTGEVLASVSVPTFDPENIENDDDETGSKFLNRVVQGRYAPGSTMKIVTTAAALEQGVTDMEINCTGSAVVGGETVTCPTSSGHGHVDFTSAFVRSCNIYYAELSVRLGGTAMMRNADKFAFNYEFNFQDFNMLKSNFELSGRDYDLAWAGVGQYKDLVTPMHNMMITAGIANGGTVMEPKTLLEVKYGDRTAYSFSPSRFRDETSPAIADTISELMRATVDHGTATSADIGGVTINGKTGTAEYVDGGAVKNHSWFVGFSDDPQHPYAIAVILEGAGFGSAHATPLAGQIFSKALDLGY